MKSRFVLSAIFALCSLCLFGAGSPERIVRLITQIPCPVPVSGSFFCEELSGSLSFYSKSENGAVVQVGAHLFSDDIKGCQDSLVLERVERLWLELLLRRTPESQNSLLREYGIRIVLNGYLFGRGHFQSLDDAFSVLKYSSTVSLLSDEHELNLTISDSSGNELHFYLPADRDLLSPYDKKEAEDRLRQQLSEADDLYVPVKLEVNGYSMSHGFLVSGGSCYMIDSLRNDVFLNDNNGVLAPVFNKEYPEESLRNMLMSVLTPDVLSDWSVSLLFRSYSRTPDKVRMPMGTLLMFLRNQGLDVYTAIYDTDADGIRILMVLHHSVYQYIHMILLTVPSDALRLNGKHVLDAEMSMFIPQNSIRNLFNDNQ